MSSAQAGGWYSLVTAALLAIVPAPCTAGPVATLTLDAERPLIDVAIDGVTLRLRVDPVDHGFVILDPAAAARLPLHWSGATAMDVGRSRLDGRLALARLRVGAKTGIATIAAYDRACCADADGAIGPDLLPYAAIRWMRRDAPEPSAEIVLPIVVDPRTGPHARATGDADGLALSFTLYRSSTLATAAGAALLARAWGGRWTGPPAMHPMPFGLSAPTRTMTFDRPGRLAGFPFAGIAVRIADFGGHERLPADPTDPADIVVSRPEPSQEAWPAVAIGPDRLRLCAEIVYRVRPPTLTLRCAFDAAGAATAPPSGQPPATSPAR